MRIFRRKQSTEKRKNVEIRCPRCGSTNTGLVINHGTDQPDYVRVWRGHRVLTYRCFTCGQDFYQDEDAVNRDEALLNDRLIDDEEALRRAEEEIKREADESEDHRFG
jgi:DNA-directed RNA polymerase subunit RPC12/RpoP